VFCDAPSPALLVGLHMGDEFVALLAGARAPVDRLAAAQPVDDVPGQRRRHFAWTAIGEDGNSNAEVRHQRHQHPPTGPAAAVKRHPVTAIAVQLEAEAIMRLAELGVARRGVVDSRRMQFADQRR
jgi:hypothetical protein